jgi:LruC domain-containing protein
MKKYTLSILLPLVLLFLNSCKKDLETMDAPIDTANPILNLDIPGDFNFETSREVVFQFNDFKSTKSGSIKYNIYLYSDVFTAEEITYENEGGEMVTETVPVYDVFNNVVTTAFSDDGQFVLNLTIPIYYENLYVVRNEMGLYTSEIVPIEDNKAVYNGQFIKSTKDDPVDVIYGVNSPGDVFTINPESGEMVIIDQFPNGHNGSVTCALDPINRVMYTIVSNTRWLLAYHIDDNSWEEIGYTGLSGPRLEYRKEDGLLYFSTSNKVMTLNPATGGVISTYTVNGLHNSGWGDVAFDENGILFMATYSGLYRCDPTGNNTYQATRISAENLPFRPTSMTFDSNGELWIGSNEPNGQVVVMDQVTGGWEYRFQNMITTINDLTFLPLDENDVQETDTDGDGVIDFYDEYPNDADKAYNSYTPSIYGWGSYAFEDLWPYQGDYDFNDMVINYRIVNIANSNDEMVETRFLLKVKNVGGSFHNGFGIELDMDESLIESFTGGLYTEGIINNNGKGLESNQAKPVIIPFDDAWNQVNSGEMEFIISYVNPIGIDQFGELNPFIFINGDRGREVHLANKPPTSLVNSALFGTADDDSDPANGRYYKNKTNLPWGIDIIHDFIFLQEKQAIINGYNRFAEWAESGGVDYPDWYKDQDGYRNNQYLVYE